MPVEAAKLRTVVGKLGKVLEHVTRRYRQTLLSVTRCYRLTLCVTKSAGLESYQWMLSQWSAPQYGLCQGLFVAHTSIAVTALQIHFHSHGLVKAYSSQGIMK